MKGGEGNLEYRERNTGRSERRAGGGDEKVTFYLLGSRETEEARKRDRSCEEDRGGVRKEAGKTKSGSGTDRGTAEKSKR